jgi:CRISPR type III-A-associated RAMP protein Csm4
MNPGLVVKLRPTGPWRIGPDSGARNRVDVIYHSDSLYAAVTSAMSRLGTLEEWLDATARSTAPLVSFSSCFPFLDEIGFVVPPRNIWPPRSAALTAPRVRWKSARFVPLGIVQAILEGKRLDENQWAVDGVSGCLTPAGRPGPFRTSVRWSAAVDRLSGATERHSTACIEFRAGSGLWTIVSFRDEAAREQWAGPVKAAFRLLADTGFGGERSRGWGRSEAPEFVEGVLPDMILGTVKVAVPAPPANEPVAPESASAQLRAPVAVAPLSVPPAHSSPSSEQEPLPEILAATPAGEHPTGEPPVETPPVQEPPQSEPPVTEPPSEPEPVNPPEPPPVPEPEALQAETPGASEEHPAEEPPPSAPPAQEPPQLEPPITEPPSEPEPVNPPEPLPVPEPEALQAETPGASEEHPAPEPSTAAPSTEAPHAQALLTETPEAAVETAPGEPSPDVPPAQEPPPPQPPVTEPPGEPLPMPGPEEPPAKPQARQPETTTEPSPRPHANVTAHWLLSLFTPSPADTVDWARGNYTLLTRGGRVDSPAGSGELKKQLPMLAEGSVVYAASTPCGSAPDVAPDGFAHPVFRAGFALSIPLPEVS